MTRKKALALAKIAANNYANTKQYSKHIWDEDWMHEWYEDSEEIFLDHSTKYSNPKLFEKSVKALAEEIILRNSPLMKALQE